MPYLAQRYAQNDILRSLGIRLYLFFCSKGPPWWLSDGKESARYEGDPGSIPGSGNPLEKEMATHSNILAENSKDRGAWCATVHGVSKSRTRLSD